jgi:hypothetical protein
MEIDETNRRCDSNVEKSGMFRPLTAATWRAYPMAEDEVKRIR